MIILRQRRIGNTGQIISVLTPIVTSVLRELRPETGESTKVQEGTSSNDGPPQKGGPRTRVKLEGILPAQEALPVGQKLSPDLN